MMRKRLFTSVRAAPKMQAPSVVVHVFGFLRVNLDHGVFVLPKQVFDLAHRFPFRGSLVSFDAD